jgi:hypothetical protein
MKTMRPLTALEYADKHGLFDANGCILTFKRVVEDTNALYELYEVFFTEEQKRAAWALAYETQTHFLNCVRTIAIGA